MHNSTVAEKLNHSLNDGIKEATGESVAMCYQCGKCSAGCPLVDEMEIPPNQILRMLQLEFPDLDEKVLRSQSIWLCLSCETCVSRCPKNVDLPLIMDYLRTESVRQDKVNPGANDILAFHRTFLDSIKYVGRLFEVGLIAGYKMRTLHLLQDVLLTPEMISRGKLRFIPHMIHNQKAISKIFEKTIEEEGK